MYRENANRAGLIVHPAPAGEKLSGDYTLTANEESVPVYSCRVSAVPLNQVWPGYQRPLDQTELAAFGYFDNADATTIQITTHQVVQSVVIRPLSRGIKPTITDHQIKFVLPGPGQFTVEVNGWHHALHLFANPPEVDVPPADTPDVLFFGPGVHHPGKIDLESHQTVYVAGGAVVYGSFHAQGASHIQILGRGIIDVSEAERAEGGGAIRLADCTDIRIEGLVLRDPDVWCCSLFGCQNAEISNLKLVGLWRYNADGIDICNSENIHIQDCFVRAFDDNIVLKGLKWGNNRAASFDERPVRNVVVERCVLWNDWGRALEIGAETSAPEIAHIVFRDCDIIRATHIAIDIQHGDRATVRDILFENIRVEVDDFNLRPVLQEARDEKYRVDPTDRYQPYLLYIIIHSNFYSRDQKMGVVRDIVFKDISVNADRMPPSYFKGADEAHNVTGVTVKNLMVNGQACCNQEAANLEIHPFVENVIFEL